MSDLRPCFSGPMYNCWKSIIINKCLHKRKWEEQSKSLLKGLRCRLNLALTSKVNRQVQQVQSTMSHRFCSWEQSVPLKICTECRIASRTKVRSPNEAQMTTTTWSSIIFAKSTSIPNLPCKAIIACITTKKIHTKSSDQRLLKIQTNYKILTNNQF